MGGCGWVGMGVCERGWVGVGMCACGYVCMWVGGQGVGVGMGSNKVECLSLPCNCHTEHTIPCLLVANIPSACVSSTHFRRNSF